MAMPEAPMHEYTPSTAAIDDVRSAGHVLSLRTKPKALPVEYAAYCKLRSSIVCAHSPHPS